MSSFFSLHLSLSVHIFPFVVEITFIHQVVKLQQQKKILTEPIKLIISRKHIDCLGKKTK